MERLFTHYLLLTQGFACHNHIRVFKKIPGQDTLLVCGTYAGVEPHCLGNLNQYVEYRET